MAKRQPEKYEPGELDRTRKNLGGLSREEAERMSKILGGEVGIEKTDKALQEKYDKLQQRSESKKSKAGETRVSNVPAVSSKSTFSGHYRPKPNQKKPRVGYLDRIKIDLIASRPEHQVKNRSSLVSTYLSFIVKGKDTVNPDFLIEGDSFYYSHIETLVTKLKLLLKQVKPDIFKNYINPFYRDILKLIISWDLESLSSTLSNLQKKPRNVEVVRCSDLCRYIYKPIFRLTDIDLKYINEAVDRLFKVLSLLKQDEADELIEIKKNYLDIKEKIKTVFKEVPYTCYPLLLKLTSNKFYYYAELRRKNLDRIIDFLQIEEPEILLPPPGIESLEKKQYSLAHLKKKLQKEKEDLLKLLKPETTDRPEQEIADVPEFIEQLFPESNWKNYREYPDFYPYFHPLFKFPKGTELIAPEDPLQQVIVLATIIQELLYGFRSIEIYSDMKEILDKIQDNWHFFIDDLIQKKYSKMLIEYCRSIEKRPEYSVGKFSQKLLTDIYWFKRRYIFPFIKFRILYKNQSAPLKAPKFHALARRFYLSLSELLDEFENSSTPEKVISNFNSPFKLDISNTTSSRLEKILESDNIAATNENLMRHTLQLASMLDYLLNSSNSPYYSFKAEEISVYRYDPVYHGKPLYSVTTIDTQAILQQY